MDLWTRPDASGRVRTCELGDLVALWRSRWGIFLHRRARNRTPYGRVRLRPHFLRPDASGRARTRPASAVVRRLRTSHRKSRPVVQRHTPRRTLRFCASGRVHLVRPDASGFLNGAKAAHHSLRIVRWWCKGPHRAISPPSNLDLVDFVDFVVQRHTPRGNFPRFWLARSASALFRMRSKKRIGDRPTDPTRHGTRRSLLQDRLFLTQKCDSGLKTFLRNCIFRCKNEILASTASFKIDILRCKNAILASNAFVKIAFFDAKNKILTSKDFFKIAFFDANM